MRENVLDKIIKQITIPADSGRVWLQEWHSASFLWPAGVGDEGGR